MIALAVWLLVLALFLLWGDVWSRCRPEPEPPEPAVPREPGWALAQAAAGRHDHHPWTHCCLRLTAWPQFPAALAGDPRARFQAAVEQRFVADLEAAARLAFIRNPFDVPYVIGATRCA